MIHCSCRCLLSDPDLPLEQHAEDCAKRTLIDIAGAPAEASKDSWGQVLDYGKEAFRSNPVMAKGCCPFCGGNAPRLHGQVCNSCIREGVVGKGKTLAPEATDGNSVHTVDTTPAIEIYSMGHFILSHTQAYPKPSVVYMEPKAFDQLVEHAIRMDDPDVASTSAKVKISGVEFRSNEGDGTLSLDFPKDAPFEPDKFFFTADQVGQVGQLGPPPHMGHGPCGHCGMAVTSGYVWWTGNPENPESKPLHDGDCAQAVLFKCGGEFELHQPMTMTMLDELVEHAKAGDLDEWMERSSGDTKNGWRTVAKALACDPKPNEVFLPKADYEPLFRDFLEMIVIGNPLDVKSPWFRLDGVKFGRFPE